MDWLTRAILHLLPQPWRSEIESDLAEDSRRRNRGLLWRVWEAVRIVATWRGAFGVETAVTDLKYAARSLMHARWFTAGAVFTFALGIGVNAAVFSLVDRMLLRPLPYARAEDVVMLFPVGPDGSFYSRTPKPLVVYAKAQPGLFAGLAGAGQSSMYAIDPSADDDPGVRLTSATYDLLNVLGVHPVLGRDFTRADALQQSKLALITYEVWQSRFGGRADVIGRQLGKASRVDIVGVLPRGFVTPTAFWSDPSDGLELDPDLMEQAGPRDGVWPVVARLGPGVSRPRAQAAVDALCARVSSEAAGGGRPAGAQLRVLVEGAQDALFHNVRMYLWLVTCAAVLVLLVACANLSSLLLARGRSREHLAALRTALGASRGRLIAAGLIECGLVAVTGAAIAIVVLAWISRALVAIEPSELQRYAVDATDPRLIAIMLGAVVLCVVFAGLWPAIRASRVDVQSFLQQGVKTGRRTRSISARSLLVVEAALGVLLVSGAVVTGRSLIGILNRDLGFVPADTYLIYPALPLQDPGRKKMAMYRQVLDVLRADSGVAAAGGVDVFTIGKNTAMRGFPLAPGPRAPSSETYLYQVTGSYFDAIRARFVVGRAITDDDVRHHALVAVLSESGARLLWPDEKPAAAMGRVFQVPKESDRIVVGIVADQRATSLRPAIAAAYVPFDQADPTRADRLAQMVVVVQMRPDAVPNLTALRGRLRQEYVQFNATMRDARSQLDPAVSQPKLQSYLFGSFAIFAMVLAAGGLYSVASLDVAMRRHEMGVRMALGASAAKLRRSVMLESLQPIATGVAAGLVAAWWAGRYLQSLLDEGQARDPLMMALAAAILLAAVTAAAWVPARRAAHTDPAEVLRAQ